MNKAKKWFGRHKKMTIIVSAVAVFAILLTVFGLLFFNNRIKSKLPGSRYLKYNYVVVAEDTPEKLIEQLNEAGVPFVKHVKNQSLYGGAGKKRLKSLKAGNTVYLCEGTYQTGSAGFFEVNGSLNDLKIIGAGKDKTKIVGGSNNRPNSMNAFHFRSANQIEVSDLSVSGFAKGVFLDYTNGISIKNTVLMENAFAGIHLKRAYDTEISGNEIKQNGDPKNNNDGYGISISFDSKGNHGENNLYVNNANLNVVDCVNRSQVDYKALNPIQLSTHLDDDYKPKAEDESDDNTLRFELEYGYLEGAVVAATTEKVEQYSGNGYVYLATGKIQLDINIEKAGYYRLYVASAVDDEYSRCDKISVNGSRQLLIGTPAYSMGKWIITQPGTEVWRNNELTPKPIKEGVYLNQGKNTVEITAHWGYCGYDYILLKPIDGRD